MIVVSIVFFFILDSQIISSLFLIVNYYPHFVQINIWNHLKIVGVQHTELTIFFHVYEMFYYSAIIYHMFWLVVILEILLGVIGGKGDVCVGKLIVNE